MKKIVAIIEKGEEDGYSIYAADENIPLFSSGETEQDARTEFEQLVTEQAEFIKERVGQYPDWYDGNVVVEYRYDMSAFFLSFPFINATEFAHAIGMNPSLLRKYKSGLAKASERQKDLIQHKFEDIVRRLSQVRF